MPAQHDRYLLTLETDGAHVVQELCSRWLTSPTEGRRIAWRFDGVFQVEVCHAERRPGLQRLNLFSLETLDTIADETMTM